MKKILLILSLSLAALNCMAVQLSGRVFLQEDTLLGGDYVMIYCQACGTGTLSDENGYYSIDIPDTPENVTLEFSRIGYTTVYREFFGISGDIDVPDVVMQPQALMLTAAYVTPEGMDPGQFVLSKLWEQSRGNRKKQMNYSADINYNVATHDISIVAQILPKGTLGLLKFAAAMKGYGPLIRYCLENDELSATVTLSRKVTGGKLKDYDHKIVASNQELPKNVQKDIMSLFGMFDLFDIIYGEGTNWGEKFSEKNHFDLTGTYEYGDKLVDVLQWTDTKSNMRATVHIVEEDWGILKVQMFTSEGEVIRCEARDVGNGVYMPISFLLKPEITMIRAEQIPKLIEAIQKNEGMKKKIKERAINVLESHQGQDFNPYISFGFNIRYN